MADSTRRVDKYLYEPVAYLQNFDFDTEGNLSNQQLLGDKLVVIMIQADFCGHCSIAKPDFQKFANSIAKSEYNNKIIPTTIQGDGKEEGEPELRSRLGTIFKDFQGFPSYALMYNGNFIKMHEGGRDSTSIAKSAIQTYREQSGL
jgi:thiol-disulfide isomerase/thioredoxin